MEIVVVPIVLSKHSDLESVVRLQSEYENCSPPDHELLRLSPMQEFPVFCQMKQRMK
jgi:hypothetical protein